MLLKKSSFLPAIMLLLTVNLFAQNQNSGSITGTVVDEATNSPIEFVNVILQIRSDSTVVTGTTTDKKGKFTLSNIAAGDYYIKYSLISLHEKLSPGFKIDSQHKKVNMGTVVMSETAVNMDEVLVTSQKTMFNNAIDRKVYNVEQDIMSKSGSASELLQNIPSVQVDMDGVVSLRGSENVLILINGKVSPLMGKSRADVLQQLPANSIDKIEVITNPSAKYKPDGTSGIINIILKKNTNTGTNGSITGNVGNDSRYNGNIRLNYNPGDYNIFGSYSYRRDTRNRINSDTREQIDSNNNLSFYNENLNSYARPTSHMVALGMDYNLDEVNSLGLSGNYFYNTVTRTGTSKIATNDNLGSLTEKYDRVRSEMQEEKESGYSLYYQHNFQKEDHKLRFEFTGSYQPEVENNHYINTYYFPVNPNEYDNNIIKQTENKNQISVDYTNPISDSTEFEAGYASEFNKSDQDFSFTYIDPVSQQLVSDNTKTNRFIYNESIHALYSTYKFSLGALSILTGIRTEETFRESNLVSKDSIINNNYFNIYPTIHLSYKFNDLAELQLNYSRRAHRPESDDLNPFPEYQDPRNIHKGNPNLLPEYIHSFEFGCKFQNDDISIVPSIYYRYTYNTFTQITQAVNDTTILTTKMNLSNDQSAGMEFIISANAGKVFSAHASTNVFYNTIDASNLCYSNKKSIITWSGALTFNLNLWKATILQMSSNYSSPTLTPQGEYRPRFVANLGLRQDLFENKLSLILTVADIFNTVKRELHLDSPLLNETVINKRDGRIIYFGFTYHFGQPAKKSKEDQIKYDEGL